MAERDIPSSVHVAGSDILKVALIGCGGRGPGAAAQALGTGRNVRLWAMADAFQDRVELAYDAFVRGMQRRYDREETQGLGEQLEVPVERKFVGLDAYRHAIDSGVDLVILAEPPGFRPKHFEYAIQAGKHVFMEKPVATDVAGIHRVLETAKLADEKKLKVGVGLQRRHQPSYLEAIEKLRDGAIGNVQTMYAYWNGGFPAKQPIPKEDKTELEYQVRNWYFFTWLGGDHICEQHVHNLDVCNWVHGSHPVEAQGMGGREVRTGKQYGHIFDHHAVEFTYADGTKMFSQCRQIPGCTTSQTERIRGNKGTLTMRSSGSSIESGGKRVWRSSRSRGGLISAYQLELNDLLDAIYNDKPYNEAEYGATATMTAILGRMATYSGKALKWDDAFNSGQKLTIDAEDWQAETPIKPDDNGWYPVAVPGRSDVL